MPKFEIEFRDGRKVVKEANTRDDAKVKAKTERRQELPRDTPNSAAEIMVKRIEQVD